MSSRFVSAGTINGDGRITATTTTTTTTAAATAAVPAPPSLPPAGEKATSTPTPTPSRPEDQQQQQAATAQWETKAAPKINSEWEAVTRDLEADRRRREEARRALVEGGSGGGDRSLFEVLQANKGSLGLFFLLFTFTFTFTFFFFFFSSFIFGREGGAGGIFFLLLPLPFFPFSHPRLSHLFFCEGGI